MAENPGRDFFISYTAPDVPWAEWIAVTLEQAGYTVLFQEWDFHPGDDFVHLMHEATRDSARTVAVLSPTYFESGFGEAEWAAAFARDPLGEKGLLLPVKIQPCEPSGLLASRIRVDLTDVADERTARDRLLAGVRSKSRLRPTHAEFPGSLPASGDSGELPGYPGFAAHVEGPPPAAPERSPWEWLRRHRPRTADLLGDHADMLGHRGLRDAVRSRIDAVDTAALVLLAGPAGSGKSTLLSWLCRVAGDRFVDAAAEAERLARPLRDDGADVRRLLRALRPAVDAAGDQVVLVYDDVDHDLREPGINHFVQEAIAQLNVGFLLLATSTPLTPQLFPIPVTELNLDRRRANLEDFDRFLDRVLDGAGTSRGALSEDLRRSLYDMSEQTANFRAVQYVVEMLVEHHRWTRKVTHPAVLRRLLASDPYARRLELPAVRATRGPRLSFRRKDKSESLAEVLLRHFETPRALVDAAQDALTDFDEEAFLAGADQSFVDAVVALCLTHSPRDLVLLLGPESIRQEIRALHLDPEELFDERAEEADLLVRGLGYTLVDIPKGLNAFKAAVHAARSLVEEDDARANVVNAAGKTVIQHVHSALLDLLHFWATSLFGSVRDLVMTVNAERADNTVIDGRHLRTDQVVELLRHLNESAQADASTYQLTYSDPRSPVSAELLRASTEFADAADAFAQLPRSSMSGLRSGALRTRVDALVTAADDVLRSSEDSFPSVIKLSEIVFDEYSRKIFRGTDSDNNEVRFAMTGDDERDELVVAAHYFMLPKKRVSVNPHIVPRGGARAPVLFDRPQAYDARSTTQQRQADRLLELVALQPEDSVVDVGSGTGALAVAVASRVREVHGIDKSAEMVRQAQQRARGAESTNVTFEVVDLLEYDAREAFDVALSNATMHWVLPEDRAYQRLFRLLRRGGRLGVHQGGHGNYRGLHTYTRKLLKDLGLGEYYLGWAYPIYYPTVEQYRELLQSVGFEGVEVVSAVTDGSEFPNLIQDFSEAGLLPYLKQLPEVQQDSFRAAWLEDAEDSAVDLYSHRLYAVARRP